MSRGNSLSRGLRRASSLKEGAFGMAAKFSGVPEDDFPRSGEDREARKGNGWRTP